MSLSPNNSKSILSSLQLNSSAPLDECEVKTLTKKLRITYLSKSS